MKTLSKGENTPLESQVKTVSFSSLQQAMLIVKNQNEVNDVMPMEALSFDISKQRSEKAVILGRLYLRNNEWT